ncbi:MAG: hypothetical protein AB9897_00945 [Anaerolineaceae bacterium]
MKIRIILVILWTFLAANSLSSCSRIPFLATHTPTPTNTPAPINTPQPTATSTVTPTPYFVTALVLPGDLQAPIMIYHRFANDTHTDTSTYVRQSTFKEQLQKLYDAGFSMVSMSSWLDGSFVVPEGRKPLLITLDDAWFADQLYINSDGSPSEFSGLGILYQFSKDHPDFNFAASVYADMGDKVHYGDKRVGDWFYWSETDADKTVLANVIVWALENGVEVYNHTYEHADLSLSTPGQIEYELQAEDETLRQYLALVNRSDLNAKLGNIIALPYGIWPSTIDGMAKLKEYVNPEGKPVSAILAAYNSTEAMFTPSVFSANFDRMNLPRIETTNYSIDWVVAHKEEIPSAQSCVLGPTSEEQAGNILVLQALVGSAIQQNNCPEGVYHVNGFIFIAKNNAVTPYSSPTE